MRSGLGGVLTMEGKGKLGDERGEESRINDCLFEPSWVGPFSDLHSVLCYLPSIKLKHNCSKVNVRGTRTWPLKEQNNRGDSVHYSNTDEVP